MLIERDELTSGTTWHSAAQVTNFGMTQTMVGLKSHSIALYQDLRDDADYPVGYNYGDGGIRLANTEAQMDGYRHFASVAAGMGVTFEVIDAEECARRHPLISTDNLLGGLWDPTDGHIDPAQLCQALARRARLAGAEVNRHTPVTGLTQHADRNWTVHTEKGDVRQPSRRLNGASVFSDRRHPCHCRGGPPDPAFALPDQRLLQPSRKGRASAWFLRTGLPPLGDGWH
jgi:dimethylglycine dehydrogenase